MQQIYLLDFGLFSGPRDGGRHGRVRLGSRSGRVWDVRALQLGVLGGMRLQGVLLLLHQLLVWKMRYQIMSSQKFRFKIPCNDN